LQDTSIPGYLPSELFKQLDEVSLRAVVCQRCHFLRFYNTALNVIVSPDDYQKLMAHLKDKKALIVLMVDLLDFPCSIWPGLVNIIGKFSLSYNN
jgi:ribosome biogenesis GTPase A